MDFKLLSKNVKHLEKKIFDDRPGSGKIIPFPVWLIPFPVLKINFELLGL